MKQHTLAAIGFTLWALFAVAPQLCGMLNG